MTLDLARTIGTGQDSERPELDVRLSVRDL